MHPTMRVLLNQAPTGGGGGGAAPPAGGQQPPAGQPTGTTPAPGAPSTPGAQGTPAPGQDEIPAWFARAQDSMFANMRKMVEGIVSKAGAGTPPASGNGTPAAGATSAAPTGTMTMGDVQAELDRRDEFTRAIAGVSITPGQLGLMQNAFKLERPENPTLWAQTYLAASGIGKTPVAAGASGTQPNTQGQQGPPASDGGGVAAPPRNLDGVNLFTMSAADREHFIREKGLDAYRKLLMEQSRGTTVKLR